MAMVRLTPQESSPVQVQSSYRDQLLQIGYILGRPIASVDCFTLQKYIAVDLKRTGRPKPAQVAMIDGNTYTLAILSIAGGLMSEKSVRLTRQAVESSAVSVFELSRIVSLGPSVQTRDSVQASRTGTCYRGHCYELELCNWSRAANKQNPYASKGDDWDSHTFLFDEPPSRDNFRWLVSNLPWLATAVADIMPAIDASAWPVLVSQYKTTSTAIIDGDGDCIGGLIVRRNLIFSNRPSVLYTDPVTYLEQVVRRYRGEAKRRAVAFLQTENNKARWRELVATYGNIDYTSICEISMFVANSMLYDAGIRKSQPLLIQHEVEHVGELPAVPTQPSRRIHIDS